MAFTREGVPPQQKLRTAGVGTVGWRMTSRQRAPVCLLLFRAFCLFGAVCLLGNVSQAQDFSAEDVNAGQTVIAIDLIASPTVDTDALKPLIAQQTGQPYTQLAIEKSVAALRQTETFTDVNVSVVPESDGVRVQFLLQPVFYVSVFDFPGALGVFPYSQLLGTLNWSTEQPYQEQLMLAGRDRLIRLFAQDGLFAAKVTPESRPDPSRKLVPVIYHVALGKRARLGNIEITGADAQETARLQATLRSLMARLRGGFLKRGQVYQGGHIQSAVRRMQGELAKQSYLAGQVQLGDIHYDNETNRADIQFKVTQGEKVAVMVTGARVSKKTLQSAVPIYDQGAVDRDLIETGRRNLVSYFQRKGFFETMVTVDTKDDANETVITYAVARGKRHRVADVKIAGNAHFPNAELTKQITVTKGKFLSRGAFSQDLLQKSQNNLQAYARNNGYPEAKVTTRVEDRDANLDVTFQIDEGQEAVVDSFDVEGDNRVQVGVSLGRGDAYALSKVAQDRSRILATYLDLGYLNATFQAEARPVDGDSHKIAVVYRILEGPRVSAAGVVYTGQKKTRDKTIATFADLGTEPHMSDKTMLAAASNLYDAGLFDWVDVEPERPITTQTSENVLVRVHEERQNSVSYGFGFESTPRTGSLSGGTLILPGLPAVGLPSNFKVIESNVFSPLGSVSYTRLNVFGLAHTASVSVLASRLDQRLSLSYGAPRVLSSRWNGLLSLSAERNATNPLFYARVEQVSLEAEKPLDAKRTERLQLRYTLEHTSLSHLLIQNFVPEEDLSTRLSGFSATFIRDTRDTPLDAHKGVFETVDALVDPKVLGSSDNVLRFFGQGSYYRQIKNGPVWANSIRYGAVSSFGGEHVPFSERFFSGGAYSLRGFALNGAGPQDVALLCSQENNPSSCTARVPVPVGGRQLLILNSELRFPFPTLPLVGTNLGGVLFYDGGNVYSAINLREIARDYTNTVGAGLRFRTPIGPLRIDFGRNLNPLPGTKALNIFVTLGQAF
jgi:outer membrane protein insertion porin family